MQTEILILLFLVSGLMIFGYYLSNVVLYPKKLKSEQTYQIEVDAGKIDEASFQQREKIEVAISSPYGYSLHGFYFPFDHSKKTVIISHGITYSLYGSVKYMELFVKRGYNILLYDNRNHGKSGGKNTTYGYFEKYDLKACADWVFTHCGDDSIVGLMGESMGAAISLLALTIDPRISFCIADCAYSDLDKLLRYRMKKEYHLPAFPFIQLANFWTELRTGMGFKVVSPIEDMHRLECPILFIHGQQDEYIPKEMSIEMYERKLGAKQIYLAPNAGHAESYWNNRQEYDRIVGKFLEDNVDKSSRYM
jgi:fermentation-respiration switch protein FrsA (DUF1100 family)